MPDLLVFVARDETLEAFAFGPDQFSAWRKLDGVWASPVPDILVRELLQSFVRVDDEAARELSNEAHAALAHPALNQPRASPAKLIAAAKDYNSMLDHNAGILARRTIQNAALHAKAPPRTSRRNNAGEPDSP